MKSFAVDESKAQFSAVVKEVQEGHPVAVIYSHKRTPLAVLVSYDQNDEVVRAHPQR